MNSFIQLETQWGKPIHIDDRRIIVQSRALQIRVPVLNSAFVWNRPVSVLVQYADGRDQVLPVRDVTRLVQALLFIYTIVSASIISIIISRRSR
jgi:hypothetical protein